VYQFKAEPQNKSSLDKLTHVFVIIRLQIIQLHSIGSLIVTGEYGIFFSQFLWTFPTFPSMFSRLGGFI